MIGKGKGGLRDRATLQGVGIQNRGGKSRSADPVAAAYPGGEMGISTH